MIQGLNAVTKPWFSPPLGSAFCDVGFILRDHAVLPPQTLAVPESTPGVTNGYSGSRLYNLILVALKEERRNFFVP